MVKKRITTPMKETLEVLRNPQLFINLNNGWLVDKGKDSAF